MGLLFGGDCYILDAEKLGGVTVEENLKAYDGKGPYIFISYAHKDNETVLPLIEGLKQRGFNVWYDAGIEAGTEWPEYIGTKVFYCNCLIHR